mmetsp:Transcript_23820/g.60729  ORF Transcript_23820/g.60729 Transcript_23820/m.60729 type:complete len:381 (-) Transcript_23820:414-1556(-)
MARFGLGSILGAGAAGAYGMQQINSQGFSNVMGRWFPSFEGVSMPQMPGQSSELTQLQKEMSKLAGMVSDIARNNNRPTVLHVGGNQRGWSVIILPSLAGGAVLYLYCRFTGTSVLDFFYVSRSSLASFRNTVQESMTKMWEEMRKQKDEVIKMVTHLGRKQDDLKDQQDQLMAKQDQMDERLRRVDDTVYQLDGKANHTIQHVEKLDSRLQDVHSGVMSANQGIYMLVSAVSEVTHKIGLHNSRTAQALQNFLRSGPTWAGGAALPAGATAPGAALASGTAVPQLTGAPSFGASAGSGSSVPTGGLRGLMPETDSAGTSAGVDSYAYVSPGGGAPALHGGPAACVVQELPSATVSALASAASAPVGPVGQGLRVLGFSS